MFMAGTPAKSLAGFWCQKTDSPDTLTGSQDRKISDVRGSRYCTAVIPNSHGSSSSTAKSWS